MDKRGGRKQRDLWLKGAGQERDELAPCLQQFQPLEGDDPPCAAPFDGFHGVFYSGAQNGAWREIPDVTGVRGVLYDHAGLRAVVTDLRGVLGLLPPSDGGVPQPAWQKRYMTGNEENRTPLEDIWPSCL